MSATSFTIDSRDVKFVLFEQLDIGGTLPQYPRYADHDGATYEQIVDEAIRISVSVLGPTNHDADRIGCKLDAEGNVTTPPGFKEAFKVMAEGGFIGLVASPDLGGLGMPQSLGACVSELSTGANMGLATYPGLAASAGSLLSHYAPEPLRTLVCTKMFSGEWGGTMCLTEAGAGSSVGDNRCKALPTEEPGVFELTGEKVFITGGDQDLTDNIMHLVLARTPGAPAGTKGISIFLVPKYWFDMDGTMGDRNGAYVEKIEEKMGLHGSATCVLSLGARGRCRGWLLGKENQGMAIMFHMMNEARIQVGAQGLAGAAAAYQNALTYARTRVQGQPVERFGDNTAASVTIVNHPDVRRMLMWQKVHVETMRSFVYSLANRLDRAENGTDEAEKEYLHGLVDLMTPVVKSYCSDRGFESTVLAMQVYGGYGYIGEYPVEQIVRDTKISSIYEGTNGIQAMDLVGRKMRKGGGMLFMQWLQEVNDELEKCKELPELAPAVADLEKAKDGVGAAAMHIGGLGMEGNIRGAMLNASNFLDQLGCVVLGMHALWQARVALSKLAGASEGDARYYKGKLLNLQFYVGSVLPRATALGKIIRSNDMSCLDEALFGEL